jgi:hypothetical protein
MLLMILLPAIIVFSLIAARMEIRFMESVLTPEELGNYPGPM